MSKWMRAIALTAIFALPATSQAAFITGDVTGGGSFTGTVTRSDAWVQSNPIDGMEVNFWTLSGNAGDSVSLFVTSSMIELGVSLYRGMVDELDLIVPGFNNAGDFADNLFVAGTFEFGAIGAELVNIILPENGFYTLAIGGEQPIAGTAFNYNLDVNVTSAVPLPAAVWLLGSALLGLGVMRRRSCRLTVDH
jgi:hypothetical protein